MLFVTTFVSSDLQIQGEAESPEVDVRFGAVIKLGCPHKAELAIERMRRVICGSDDSSTSRMRSARARSRHAVTSARPTPRRRPAAATDSIRNSA
jgi:hypothetical protein